MGLYNALFKVNVNAGAILAMLDLTPNDCGRFRDAWIEKGGKTVIVFTRNGGGNREEYQSVMDDLAKHPQYVEDFDDEYDSTYAHIRFNVPNDYAEVVAGVAPTEDVPTLQDKFEQAIAVLGASN